MTGHFLYAEEGGWRNLAKKGLGVAQASCVSYKSAPEPHLK